MTLSPCLFAGDGFEVRAATRVDIPALSNFCRENPSYDILLTGESPIEGEWVTDFLDDLPPTSFGWSATHKLIGVAPDVPDLVLAIMDVSEDMLAPRVGHIGLFQVAERMHGTGFANYLYGALEAWLKSRGMDAVRLGVLEENPRGAAFWTRHGYTQTRTRQSPPDAPRVHNANVLWKPLRPQSLEAYRARVPRDDPALA